jgi:cell pole-organizing protein PopZ
MTDPTAQEPTMEEILASIRRIISEDDAPAEAAAPEPEPVAAPAPAPTAFTPPVEPAPAPEPVEAEEDVLELTDVYEAPAAESIGDLDVFASEPEPEPAPAPAPAPKPAYDALVGESAAASAASAFAGFASSLKKPEPAPAPSGGDLSFLSGSTVEGMVAEMLKPLLTNWLDANLPGIVEAAVKAEVERIAKSAT